MMKNRTSKEDGRIRSFAKEKNKGNHALKQMSFLHSDRQLRDEMDSRDLLYTFIVFASRAVWKLGASADTSHLRDTRNEREGKKYFVSFARFRSPYREGGGDDFSNGAKQMRGRKRRDHRPYL